MERERKGERETERESEREKESEREREKTEIDRQEIEREIETEKTMNHEILLFLFFRRYKALLRIHGEFKAKAREGPEGLRIDKPETVIRFTIQIQSYTHTGFSDTWRKN